MNLTKYRIIVNGELYTDVTVLGEAKILGGDTDALMHFHGKNLDRNGAIVQRRDGEGVHAMWVGVAQRVDGSWRKL